MTDITKKIVRKVIKKKKLEKEHKAKQVESFSSTVSHELQTPISSILFFIERINEFLVIC